MEIEFYTDPSDRNNIIVESDQIVGIKNQVVNYKHVYINNKKTLRTGSAIFTFKEEFGYKGIGTKNGKLNVMIEYNYFEEEKNTLWPQKYYASLSCRKMGIVRRSFGKKWWQNPDNVKWICNSLIAIAAIIISIIALTSS